MKNSLRIRDIQELKDKTKNLSEVCSSYRKQLRETRELRVELDNMKDHHRQEMERTGRERELEIARTQDLGRQIARLHVKHNKIKHEYEVALKEKDKEIEDLTIEIGERWGDLRNTKEDLIKHLSELRASRGLVLELTKENTEMDDKVTELEREVEALKHPNVAELEKPGPHKEVEGEESPDMFVDSVISECHTTTGAIAGDSDADIESFSDNGTTPKKRKRFGHPSETSETSDSSVESYNTVVNRDEHIEEIRPSNPEPDSTPFSEYEREKERQLNEQKSYYDEELMKL